MQIRPKACGVTQQQCKFISSFFPNHRFLHPHNIHKTFTKTHTFPKSNARYAHAAAAPEYEYPACLSQPTSKSAQPTQTPKPKHKTHGAIITLAPLLGSSTSPSPADTGPIQGVCSGTESSQRSSSRERRSSFEEYHEPAWVAGRVLFAILIEVVGEACGCERAVVSEGR